MFTEEGTDVAELFAEESPTAKEPQLEELVASIDSIQVKIEAEGGKRFVPMLILQSSVHAVVKDWSSKVSLSSSLNTTLLWCFLGKHHFIKGKPKL